MAELHKKITTRVTYDGMEAYVLLAQPQPQDAYHTSEIKAELYAQKIRNGIDEAAIDRMVENGIYGIEVLVAKGTPAEDGRDGCYKYHFNQELNNRPAVREDGSVDYRSVHVIEVVEEGQVVATYTEPVEGTNGMTVTGQQILCKRGRGLPLLTGKGFARSEDNRTYVAAISGKIELKNDRLVILPVYEIDGDVDMTTGNIDFRGDVLIHGNVSPGAKIRATGTVTIDGLAENCTIEAGKDVILRGGFLGGNKGSIKSKGCIIAKFMEYATAEAEGSIELTSALNCTITSYDKVLFTGKTADIVGGTVYGAAGVEAYSAGTAAEVRTIVSAGVSHELFRQASELRDQREELSQLCDRIDTGLKQFEEAAAEKHIDISRDERRVSLLRAKIAKQAELAGVCEALKRVEAIMERSQNACVRVQKTVYPGVSVEINGVANHIKDENASIEFREKQGSVIMLGMDIQFVG
jgi:hypothetical protein